MYLSPPTPSRVPASSKVRKQASVPQVFDNFLPIVELPSNFRITRSYFRSERTETKTSGQICHMTDMSVNRQGDKSYPQPMEMNQIDDRAVIGGRIRYALVQRFGTLVRAAIECDLPIRSIHRYCSGSVMPGTEVLSLLARSGISVDWLLTGRGTPLVDHE